MASFQGIVSKVATQLRELSPSQRLAILLGGLLVAGALVWMISWVASPEMVPLLPQNLEPDDLALVQSGLQALNEPFRVIGSQVLVRAGADRPSILARLQEQQKLPSDTSLSFDALVHEANPWISQSENDRRWSVALSHELERVLEQMTGVKAAKVFLNLDSGRRGFARTQQASTASVNIIMASGDPVPRPLALAAARLVAGSIRGLTPQNVSVVDGGTGRNALDWDVEQGGATQLQRLKREYEQRLAEKIRNQLADPNARVNVQIEIEPSSKTTNTTALSDPVEVLTERSQEKSQRMARSAQPGVQPNVGVGVSGGGVEEVTEHTTDQTQYRTGETSTVEQTPAGEVRESLAAINISHSYLATIFKRLNAGDAEPTEADIVRIFESEKTKVVNQITALVKPQESSRVRVDWYYDQVPVAVAAAGAFDDPLALARRYGPQSGLALLALLSLGLMMRLAKKSADGEAFGLQLGLPREAIEAARRAAEDVREADAAEKARAATEASVSAIPHAAATEGLLVGKEVDEKTVQINKMIEQVNEMLEQNPEALTNLFEHWVEQDS